MKLVKIENDTLVFEDGTAVSFYHEQDCCESVYADFSQLKDKVDSGKPYPHIYGTKLDEHSKGVYRDSAFVHYLDGTIKKF